MKIPQFREKIKKKLKKILKQFLKVFNFLQLFQTISNIHIFLCLEIE